MADKKEEEEKRRTKQTFWEWQNERSANFRVALHYTVKFIYFGQTMLHTFCVCKYSYALQYRPPF